jgi:hypothetical protein
LTRILPIQIEKLMNTRERKRISPSNLMK